MNVTIDFLVASRSSDFTALQSIVRDARKQGIAVAGAAIAREVMRVTQLREISEECDELAAHHHCVWVDRRVSLA